MCISTFISNIATKLLFIICLCLIDTKIISASSNKLGGLPVYQFSGTVWASLKSTLDFFLKFACKMWAECQLFFFYFVASFSHAFTKNHYILTVVVKYLKFKNPLLRPFIIPNPSTHTFYLSFTMITLLTVLPLMFFGYYLFYITVQSDSVPICFPKEVSRTLENGAYQSSGNSPSIVIGYWMLLSY